MKNLILTIIAIFAAQAGFACSASFTYSTSAVNNNLLVLQYNLSSTAGTVPAGYHLENIIYFGDGTSSQYNGNTTSIHNYSAPGTYNVKLMTVVEDSTGINVACIDSVTHAVTMAYSSCAASWVATYGTGGSVTFTATNPAGTPGIVYDWNFGDGTYGIGNPVTHTYAANGSYLVSMMDSSSACGYVSQAYATVTSLPACLGTHASFTSSVSGNTAIFNNTSTGPSFYTAMNITWNYGDGSSGYSYSHTYTTAGTYTVGMRITWLDSATSTVVCSDSASHTVTIAATNPCAGSHALFTSSTSGLTTTFTNSSTYAGFSASPVATWYFGDGNTSSSYSPTHTYATAGTYYVDLVMTWYDSLTHSTCIDSAFHSVTVSSGSSCAGSHALFTSSTSGLTTMFTNTSTYAGFSASPVATWYFGDGNTSSSYSPTHTYATAGTYYVDLVMTWYDSLTHSTCIDSAFHSVTVSSGSSCAGSHALFTSSTSGLTTTFTNTSTYAGFSASPVAAWSFGDGNSSSSYSPTHTYATAGTYYVDLVMIWYDSLTHSTCLDSAVHSITIGAPVNEIRGSLLTDSLYNPMSPDFRVWLINYDSATSTLSAVDSVTVLGAYWSGGYTFVNEPAGNYRVKAMVTNGPTSGTGAVPTYGYNSLYWSSANIISYSGSGISGANDIHLQNGTATSGPGFIGGSVTAGANKGTQTTGMPVANLTILLEDMNGTPLAYTVTDANGSYHFANFPAGTYKVYPEVLGYATVPAIINAGTTQVTDADFIEHTISQTITPVTTGVDNVAANTASFNVFPNPGNGLFNIVWSSKTAMKTTHTTITDVVGHKVFETDLDMTATTGRTQVNISNLETGIYFITLKADGVSYATRVVLQH